ncbi:uncharacterized protein BXZ73DRAFT_101442 [Epithele typhae]|uniref:uncharacterized protein n=1 Tax=Epithele typhae TaxID=378194 RepID=UPI002008E2BE|nr:uncharacterized protein BXZ73DRAFT_101442 [Epithele typhae]KAH9932067.1 hypothetical protein BXZ73DRAFT_101442 [Epithele typhae]
MKVTSSSSFVFAAALAVSASSSALAAPTADAPDYSPGKDRSAVEYPSKAYSDHYDDKYSDKYQYHDEYEHSQYRRQLPILDLVGLLGSIPAVGGPLEGLVKTILSILNLQQKPAGGVQAENAASAPSPAQLSALITALAQAHSQVVSLSGLPAEDSAMAPPTRTR